jgi:integrating conjugative element relaxase (TIGR03760 family)
MFIRLQQFAQRLRASGNGADAPSHSELASVLIASKSPSATGAIPNNSARTETGQAVVMGPDKDVFTVMAGDALLAHVNANARLNRIRERMGFGQVHWDKDCLPVLHALAEFVQLLPASEAHHHCQPSGLLQHILETTEFALRLRQGYMLPAGAPPEQQIRLQHRWTYAVFICAALHDIAKPLTDLTVEFTIGDMRSQRWQPLAGSLRECGAHVYGVAFKGEQRDYLAHQQLALSLFQMLVPQHTRQWLLEDASASDAIQKYLTAEDKTSPIARIVTKADMASVAQNLRFGPRTRFRSARAVPLVDRLMEALRRMLIEAVVLPLNKSGAAGWVYEDSVWLVAKRVADEVRAYLAKHESADSVPGTDKNDRLFDTWQEHGMCLTNPATNGAIWRVLVEGEGYQHELTVLRFPLHKLFADQAYKPPMMIGRIQPLLAGVVANAVANTGGNPAINTGTNISAIETPLAGTVNLAESVSVSATSAVATAPVAVASAAPPIASTSLRPASAVTQVSTPAYDPPDATNEEFIAEAESASAAMEQVKRESVEVRPRKVTSVSVKGAKPGPDRPISVDEGMMPPSPLARKTKAPDKLAITFMSWLQSQLGTGEITYNQSGAPVHFTSDEHGTASMLLVTPAIYKRFAEANPDACGEAGFAAAQKAIKNSGWAAKINGSNESFARFQVLRAEGTGGNTICATVIEAPERFVNPVPPSNPRLVRVANAAKQH